MRPVDLFHLGPQKTGTTWVYRCLAEHPQIAVPPRDTIHYFDMLHARGRDFYATHFADAQPGQILFDPTPSYIRAPLAPARIAAENPKARLMLCLRDPVERAFSHYWHEKKKERFDFTFDEVLRSYDLFADWIEPGCYALHIERFLAHFPREQLLCLRFEEMKSDASAYLRRILEFAGVDPSFEPSVLNKRVNAAGPAKGTVNRALHKVDRLLQKVGVHDESKPLVTGKGEYARGVDPQLRAKLVALLEPDIARLEEILGLDLSAWRRVE